MKWLKPICLPDEEQFELEPFNKFQLEQYVQPNLVELNINSSNNQILNSINSVNNNNQVNGHQIDNQFNNQESSTQHNGSSVYSSMLNLNDMNDNLETLFLLNNDTSKSIERINSKRLKFDKLSENDETNKNNRMAKRKRDSNKEPESDSKKQKDHDGVFFSAGWGSTENNNAWKLSKVPLWMELKMLTREQCIEKNGERVKWNFICAEGANKGQETSVGDSGKFLDKFNE